MMKKTYSLSSNNLELGVEASSFGQCCPHHISSVPNDLHKKYSTVREGASNIGASACKPQHHHSILNIKRKSFALTKNQKLEIGEPHHHILSDIKSDDDDTIGSMQNKNLRPCSRTSLNGKKYSDRNKNISSLKLNNTMSNGSANGSRTPYPRLDRTIHGIVKQNLSWSPTTTRVNDEMRPRLYSSQCHKTISRNTKVRQWIEGRYNSVNFEEDLSNNEDTAPAQKKVLLRRVKRNLEEIVLPMEKLAKAHNSFENQERMKQAKISEVTRSRTKKMSRSTARRRRNRVSRPLLINKERNETLSISSESKTYTKTNIDEVNNEKGSEVSWSHQSREDFRRRRIVSLKDKLNSKGQPLLLLNYLERNQTSEALKLAGEGSSRARIDVCLLWAALNGDVEMIRLSIEHGAMVEARDSDGFSALHVAAASGSEKATETLLWEGARTIGAASWDNRGEFTPLMLAAHNGFADIVAILLRHGADIDAGLHVRSVTALHYAVRSGNIDCIQILIDGGATINPLLLYSETPLHVAVEEGYSDIVEALLKAGADVRASRGHNKTTSLHISAQGNYYHISHQLLKAGADPNQENSCGRTPLHLAAKSQCFDTVQVLLNYKANPNAKDSDGRTPLHSGIFKGSRNFECLRLMLEDGGDPNIPDFSGYTPLHLAALNDSAYCVKLFLKHGGDLTKATKGGMTALNIIMRRTPSVITHIQDSLNNAVTIVDHDQQYERDGQIQLDFRVLFGGTGGGPECHLMSCFIQEGQKAFLRHPLCETFLYLKWLRVRSFFVFNVVFYMLLVLTMMQYFYIIFNDTPAYHEEKLNKTTFPPQNSTSNFYIILKFETECFEISPRYGHMRNILLYFMWLMLTILTVKEGFQVLDSPRTYLSSLDNVLIWPVIIGAVIISVIIYCQNVICPWEYHVAALVTLCSWLELLLLVGRFPLFGLYVHMFGQVTKNFGKFILTYICLITAFSSSFGILFHNQPPFKHRLICLLKTLVMMTGEIEYDEWFYERKDKKERILYTGTSHFVFALFLMFGTIVLMNLLVGLAVSDIQGLQKSAGLDRLVRQTELIVHFETFMFSQWLSFLIPKRLSKFLHDRILLLNTMYGNRFLLNTKTISSSHLPPVLIESIKRLARNRDYYSHRRNAFADFRTLSNTIQLSSDIDGDMSRGVDAIRCGIEVLVMETEDQRDEMARINERLGNLSVLVKDSLTRKPKWSMTDQEDSYFLSCKSEYNDSNSINSATS